MPHSSANSLEAEVFCATDKAQRGLIDLPITDACREKWTAGRRKYGPVFVGHPLVELDFELIDALNYEEEATRRGYQMGVMRETLLALRRKNQDIYRNQKPRTKPQEI